MYTDLDDERRRPRFIFKRLRSVVYVNRAANSDWLNTGYDQPVNHCRGGADHAMRAIYIFVVGVALIWLVVLSHWHCRGAKGTPVVTTPPRAKCDPKPLVVVYK